MTSKYIVIKEGAWAQFLVDVATPVLRPELGAALNKMLEIGEVSDGVVIRRQDIFAPPALDAYANSIRTAVLSMREAVSLLDGFPDTRSEINERIAKLEAVADYFHEQAALSWDAHRKLPD